jgi:hypothetical protein
VPLVLEETYSIHEEHERHNHYTRVQHIGIFITLSENLFLRVPGFKHDLFIEVITGSEPSQAIRAGEGPFIG